MSLFRSSWFALVIALGVLAGYADALGSTGHHHHPAPALAASSQGEPADSDDDGDGDGCHCVYHLVYVAEEIAPPTVRGRLLEAELSFAVFTAAAPEVAPRGIEYPPQLA